VRFSLPVLAALAIATPLAGQTDPELQAAVRLAQEGQGDSARALAGRILAASAPGQPRYVEALYTVALVSASADDRRLHLQRIAVEFSHSEWADDALLQLAQLDYAARNPAGTVENIQRLLGDYPLSPIRATAALWGARAAFDQRDNSLACQWSELGLAAVGSDLEIRNQLEFLRERCRAIASADSAAAARAAPPPPPPPPPPTGWQVQVAAFKTAAETEGTVSRLKELDYPAQVVQEGAWFKVRAGPFPDRTRAQQALTRISRSLGVQPFLVPPPR
jgi:hypothetical protein